MTPDKTPFFSIGEQLFRFEPSSPPSFPPKNMNSLSKVKVKRDEKNCYSKASFTGARGKTPMFNRGKFLKFYLKVIKKHPPAVGGTNRKKIPSVEGSEFLSLLYFYSQFSSTSASGNVLVLLALVFMLVYSEKKTLKKAAFAFMPLG